MTSFDSSISRSILYLVTHPHPNWFGQVTWLIGEGVPWVSNSRQTGYTIGVIEEDRSILNFIEQQGLDTTVLLNDNVQVAREMGIGVHLGQSDMLPREARAILGPDVPIGWTIHDDVSLIGPQEQYIQYVGVGPMFPTTTKQRHKTATVTDTTRKCLCAVPIASGRHRWHQRIQHSTGS